MDQQMFTITFDNSSAADANRWASNLKEYILDVTSDVEVKQQRDNPYSQDLGATLSLVLAAPAVVAVVQALGNWLMKHRDASISIETAQGKLIGTNLTNKDAMKLAELFLAHKEKE